MSKMIWAWNFEFGRLLDIFLIYGREEGGVTQEIHLVSC